MSFLTQRFIPNAIDVAMTGKLTFSMPVLRADMLSDHRISSRKFVTDLLSNDSIGAELGVFTGLFSVCLLKYVRAKKSILSILGGMHSASTTQIGKATRAMDN